MKRNMMIGCMAAIAFSFVGQMGFAMDTSGPMLARKAKFEDGVITFSISAKPLAVAEIENGAGNLAIITAVDNEGKAYLLKSNRDWKIINPLVPAKKRFKFQDYKAMLSHRGDVVSAVNDGQDIVFDTYNAAYIKKPSKAVGK